MHRRARVMTLLGMALLLVVAAALSGCGGGAGESNTIILGWLADQTGPSSGAFREVMMGWNDYMAEINQTNPIPHLEIKTITYDTRLENARIPIGYDWLSGQGMDLLLGYDPVTPNITQADQAADKIPEYSFAATPSLMDADWVYSYAYTFDFEGRAIMDYLLNQWYPSQNISGPLNIGWIGNPEVGAYVRFQAGFEYALAQNPGKAVLTKAGGSATQSAWVSEVAIIKDCDVLIMTTVGTSTATFLKEAIQRGFDGQIIASSTSVLGVWDLVTALVPKSSFDGMLIPHFYPLWTDDTTYSDHVNEMISKYRPSEAAKLKTGTTWISGWLTAQIVTEAVREAAAKVGAENVDGEAIRDAMHAIDLEIAGMPNMNLAGGHHVFQSYCRMIEYQASEDNWFAITDWFIAPGFTS